MWGPGLFGRPKLQEPCIKFYKDKTLDRLKMFLSSRDKSYSEVHVVNDNDVGKIESLLQNFDWDKICDGISTQFFHGDLQFDNVIYNGQDFSLIDWTIETNNIKHETDMTSIPKK